ncbi:hypothetical protein V5799_008342 [Amblyomma americanum]|uniref:Secreted protein n=1 Tax=Amblyomma americanum TaxID=6943 RepID=A0AAQ4FF59_AMBAM
MHRGRYSLLALHMLLPPAKNAVLVIASGIATPALHYGVQSDMAPDESAGLSRFPLSCLDTSNVVCNAASELRCLLLETHRLDVDTNGFHAAASCQHEAPRSARLVRQCGGLLLPDSRRCLEGSSVPAPSFCRRGVWRCLHQLFSAINDAMLRVEDLSVCLKANTSFEANKSPARTSEQRQQTLHNDLAYVHNLPIIGSATRQESFVVSFPRPIAWTWKPFSSRQHEAPRSARLVRRPGDLLLPDRRRRCEDSSVPAPSFCRLGSVELPPPAVLGHQRRQAARRLPKNCCCAFVSSRLSPPWSWLVRIEASTFTFMSEFLHTFSSLTFVLLS